MDLGLHDFYILSDGVEAWRPGRWKIHTGSKNREKAKRCCVLVCEDPNIKGMMKNRHLSKAVASTGWYGFLTTLRYKLERAGKHFMQASRWFASAQTCHSCGHKNPEVKDLCIREWTCPPCRAQNDRDGNVIILITKERSCPEAHGFSHG